MQSPHGASPRNAAPQDQPLPTDDGEQEPSISAAQGERVKGTRRRIDCTPSTALGGVPEKIVDDARDGRDGRDGRQHALRR